MVESPSLDSFIAAKNPVKSRGENPFTIFNHRFIAEIPIVIAIQADLPARIQRFNAHGDSYAKVRMSRGLRRSSFSGNPVWQVKI